MAADRQVYGYYVIRRLDTDEEVHRMAVHYPASSRMANKVADGLDQRVDLERFYYDWEDA
jgi:hypothetical protein